MFLVKNVKNSYEYFYCYILFLHIGSSALLKYAKQKLVLTFEIPTAQRLCWFYDTRYCLPAQ